MTMALAIRITSPMDKLAFWNGRANLGEAAGSNDFVLKRLELKVIKENIPDGASVLDVGCGNGGTLIALAKEKGCTGVGIDFSEAMIRAAQAERVPSVSFQVGRCPGLPEIGLFDVVLTERALINLDTLAEQRRAFDEIMARVKVGGSYLMIECSNQGNELTNEVRTKLGLKRIEPPWHNRFFDEAEVKAWHTASHQLIRMVPFESTYHFLSRVVNAKLALDQGIPDTELKYDSPINLLSLELPTVGAFGPVRLWIWKRMA